MMPAEASLVPLLCRMLAYRPRRRVGFLRRAVSGPSSLDPGRPESTNNDRHHEPAVRASVQLHPRVKPHPSLPGALGGREARVHRVEVDEVADRAVAWRRQTVHIGASTAATPPRVLGQSHAVHPLHARRSVPFR